MHSNEYLIIVRWFCLMLVFGQRPSPALPLLAILLSDWALETATIKPLHAAISVIARVLSCSM